MGRRHQRWISTLVLAGALLSAAITSAQKTNSPEGLLQTAIQKETVDGDLKAAIEMYKKVAQSKDRAIAVKALIRLAYCYQKLGDAQARTIFQQIVKEFSDQKEEVALALARLSGGAVLTGAKNDRAIWTGPTVDSFGRVSFDGRSLTYIDWVKGSLMFRDLTTNIDRVLTPPAPNYSQYAWGARISGDGRQVLYKWMNEKNTAEFRVGLVQESGFLKPRVVFTVSDFVLPNSNSFDWSPDRKWIAAAIRRTDNSCQIALIAVADGSLRILKSTGVVVAESIFFSPDSRYIAYELPAGEGIGQHDVFVIDIDASREIPAVGNSANEAVMGWSPDGRRLLFGSDRLGAGGLWGLPFAEGKPQGSPELLKPGMGQGSSLGVTASGSLYLYKTFNTRDVAIAPIDLDAGKLLGPPVSFTQGFLQGSRNPTWSRDGKNLAYPACPVQSKGNTCIVIRSAATGQVRQLPTTLSSLQAQSWSPDGRSLLTLAIDAKGHRGVFQIDALSGDVTVVVLNENLGNLYEWSLDGKKVYLRVRDVIIERDLTSARERDIYVGVKPGEPVAISPNGEYLAAERREPSTKTASLLLVPLAGGQPRELLSAQKDGLSLCHPWLPDSSGLIFRNKTGTGELWQVSIKGGQPRKLDIDPRIWTEGSSNIGGDDCFSLSPDGRSIAFQMGKPVSEVWALENFLPAPRTSAKRN